MAVPPYVTAGTAIEESWGDQIADSVVNPFATAAARSAAITSPTAGMTTALTAANATNGLEVWNGASWKRPWNMPWGQVAYAINGTTGTQSIGTNTAVTGLTTGSVSMVQNRIYRVTFQLNVSAAATAAGVFAVRDGGSVVGDHWPQLVVGGTVLSSTMVVRFVTTAATSNRSVDIIGTSTASTIITNVTSLSRQFILLEDIGPAGAPV